MIISKYEKWNIKTDYENQRKKILYLSNDSNYLIIKIKLKYCIHIIIYTTFLILYLYF